MIFTFSNIKKITLTITTLLICELATSQENSNTLNSKQILVPDGVVTIDSDPKIDQLVEAKIKVNKSSSNDEFYKIQIYNGPIDGAQETKKEFKKKYYDWPCDISFESPNYKVRVGKFKTRLEADKQLLEIRKKYSNAFLLVP